MVQRDSVMKQASTTLSRLHSWSRIQAQIRARRVHMVLEGRLRQKKLENQLKLEAKLHDLEVEWSGGSETIDEALARIHQREAAAVKRERAMAYAFSHQNKEVKSMLCSGGPTPIPVLDQEMKNLAKQIGAGAGRTAGLLLGLGKAELQHRKVPKHKVVSQTRPLKS
ncbi:UNVERIFIED_CONTAM: protein IQ-DOMAIN 1 [Sesamum radiatum]|uniref:Protein IQ-DOMAIN 1 n=1 Tax=Sesamum radiatum TaxID=300843 RepID=A0AAW2KGU4_SESRA